VKNQPIGKDPDAGKIELQELGQQSRTPAATTNACPRTATSVTL